MESPLRHLPAAIFSPHRLIVAPGSPKKTYAKLQQKSRFSSKRLQVINEVA
jgi:hypothetical protein